MLENTISKDGLLEASVLEKCYAEALDLSNEVAGYFKINKKDQFKDLNVDIMSGYTLECNRITTSVIQSMSWCLMQKAVHAGEIDADEASKDEHRLSQTELYTMPIACETDQFPENFINFSNRARNLYKQIERLDRIIYDAVHAEGNSPVQELMEQIESFGKV